MTNMQYEHKFFVDREENSMFIHTAAIQKLAQLKRKLVILVGKSATSRILGQTAQS